MAIVDQITKGVIEINYGVNGWEEFFWFADTTYAAALAKLRAIMFYRTGFFGTGLKIVRGKIKFPGNPKESKLVEVEYPLHPTVLGEANTPPSEQFTGLAYRMETPEGFHADRIFRGCPDSLVRSQNVTQPPIQPLPAGQVLSAPEIPAGTLLRYRQSFLRYLISNTIHARPVTVDGVRKWDVHSWDACHWRKVSKRDTGSPRSKTRGRRRKREAPAMPPAA